MKRAVRQQGNSVQTLKLEILLCIIGREITTFSIAVCVFNITHQSGDMNV